MFYTGQKFTDEHRRRLSVARRNRPPASDETRRKMSASMTGHKMSDKTRLALRIANAGRKYSEEARRNMSIAQSGTNSRRWKGGRHVNASGYVTISVGQSKYVLEHRLVLEKKIGRGLMPGESVHHINGVKDDNRPENLELWTKPPRPGVRASDVYHCKNCTCRGWS